MKITMNMTETNVNSMTAVAVKLANMKIIPNGADEVTESVENAKRKFRNGKTNYFAGGKISTNVNEEQYNIDFEMDDQAFAVICGAMMKLVTLFGPAITMLLSIPGMLRSIKESWAENCKDAFSEFTKQFHKPTTYGVENILCEDSGIAATVVVEKDGYGNDPHIIYAIWASEPVTLETITAIWRVRQFMAKKTQASSTTYRHETEFNFTDREVAIEDARERFQALNRDYEAYAGTLTDEESGDTHSTQSASDNDYTNFVLRDVTGTLLGFGVLYSTSVTFDTVIKYRENPNIDIHINSNTILMAATKYQVNAPERVIDVSCTWLESCKRHDKLINQLVNWDGTVLEDNSEWITLIVNADEEC